MVTRPDIGSPESDPVGPPRTAEGGESALAPSSQPAPASGSAFDSAWVKGGLRARRSLLAEVEAHALAEYPSEACGYLYGPAGDAGALSGSVRERNEADRYHALDPVTFPRTSRMYFKMNELRLGRAFDERERAGEPIKVIYHSHCDAGSYFSREDADTFAAEPPDGGPRQLMWPTSFLVVSVIEGSLAGHTLWAWSPERQQFVEAAFEVMDD